MMDTLSDFQQQQTVHMVAEVNIQQGLQLSGTPGNAGAKTVITVAASAPTLYYYCTAHSGMGGTANTNVTAGSSNFAGSILSVASVNTTAGISILKYTGTGANGTIGHGLGVLYQNI